MAIAEDMLLSTAQRVAVALDDHPALFRTATLPLRALRQPFRRREIDTYMAAHEVRRLAIGCQHFTRDGWLCADYVSVKRGVVFMDATKRFPLPTASFDFVHCEHMIEHVPYEAAAHMLAECKRILRDGGVLRIATPNLRRIAQLLADQLDPTSAAYVHWSNSTFEPQIGSRAMTNPCFVVNRMMRKWGHTFVYDDVTLRALLADVGFTEITEQQPGVSRHDDLVGVEQHQEMIGDAFNEIETMVLEATA